jgi:CRP-like cAMP-binding protein
VAGIARVVRFDDGSAIVRAGRDGDSFFVLVEGSVRVSRRGLPSLTLEEGSFFGEMALLDGGPRTATVTAKAPVACLVIGRPRFLKLLRSEPAIAVAMVEELARRLRAAQAIA